MTAITPTSTGSYQVFPFFTGSDGGATDAVYLLPPTFTYKQPIAFNVALLYIGGSDFAQYGYTSNADFTLAWSQSGTGAPSQANVVATITLTGTNMWAGAAAARAMLMGNFTSFLQWIETNLENTGVVVPGATFRISQQIADWIAAPLLESLFYRYSLSPGLVAGTAPYVDVRPGMQLRVETETSQYLSPSGAMNGYVAAGANRYFVNSVPVSGGRAVAFDPFLGTIRAPLVTGAGTAPVVAGGLPDLQPVGGSAKWVRLFYPQQIAAPGATGDATVANNPAMVAAQTLAQINQATASYPALTSTPAGAQTVFLGRAAVVPEIPIWISVRGQSSIQYVPLGTTFANLIERYTVVPLALQSQLAALTRMTTATSGGSIAIGFYTQSLLAMGSPMYDVPLIGGDGVSLTI